MLVFPGAHWEEATPESQDVDGRKLDEAASLLARTVGSNGVHELVIIRHGRMIWKGDDIDKRHGVWSATKSFTSTALGLLIEDGKCALDTRVADVLPELKAHYREITLRHFTTMTSGYRAVGDETTGSYKHGPSNTPFQPNPLPLFTPPGSQYAYWDSAMNTLALALTKIAGEPIEELFRRRVAQPIGMENWDWGDYATVDGVIVNGGSGNANKHIFITAREMARFGLLFLNGGNWNGRQLVSAKWVAEATRVQVPAAMPWAHPESDIDGRGVYGFNWWRNGVKPDGTRKFPGAPEGMFWASGHNNNKCFVIPEWNMVVVRLGLDGRAKDEVWDQFLAKIGEAVAATSKPKTAAPPNRIKVGIVQMFVRPALTENRDRIVAGIKQAAERGVRVAVFPERALSGSGGDRRESVDQAVDTIRRAARERGINVVFGAHTWLPSVKRNANWMLAIGPDGRDLLRYEKLYDNHRAMMPGVFAVDGVPCGTMICADRWLRGVVEIPILRGAQISFELSNNFASEWVAPYEWYWNVPLALRNTVWSVFANSANAVSGGAPSPAELRHGHSAIIAPDGRLVAASRTDTEDFIIADIETAQATRATAQARASHPALRPFWEAGLKLQSGQVVEAPPWTPLKSAETDITIAAAQVTEDLTAMEAMIAQASAKHADLVVFPERAITETALDRLQAAAREHRITVVVGMEHPVAGSRHNSAFVIGPEGAVLTRYDQLSAASPFQPGDNPAAMWFRVKGVPAIVTIGRDALWSELAELAAVAGAQVHIHLDHDPANAPDAALRRLQVWSNLASFQTFSATVNVVGSAIWDDLRDLEERRAEVRNLPRPNTGPVEVYSPFSANLVVRAGAGPQLIVATRRVGPKNQYHPGRTSNFNPQMDTWYRLGAAIVQPSQRKEP